MSALRPDILVVGLDPAGVECALRAAAARLFVVLVTQESTPEVRPPGGLDPLKRLAALGARVIAAQGRFRDRAHFYVEGTTIAPRRVVLAMPALAPMPAITGLDGAPQWRTGLAQATSLLVLGAGPGAGACALAVRRAGGHATLIAPAGLLPGFDAEARDVMMHKLRAEGVAVVTDVPLAGARVEACPEGYLLHPAQGGSIGFSHWCAPDLAPPDFSSLALDAAGITLDGPRPALAADGLSTENPRILALGATRDALHDAANARAEAEIALAKVMLRIHPRAALARMPRLGYGPLDLIESGISDTEAEARRHTLRVYRTPLPGGGFIKVFTDNKDRVQRFCVLGRHPGAQVTPLLQLMVSGAPLASLANLPSPALEAADALAALATPARSARFAGLRARVMLWVARVLG